MQTALTPEDCYQALSSMRNKPRYKSRYSTSFLKRNCKRLTFSSLQGKEALNTERKVTLWTVFLGQNSCTVAIPLDLCHAVW